MSKRSYHLNEAVHMPALVALDALIRRAGGSKSLASDITDIVGVVAGIKPAALIGEPGKPGIAANILEGLGLSYETWPEKGLYYVSMDQEKVRRLAELHREVWGKNAQFPEEQYEIGELLGYPKTSTDYFLKRVAVADISKMPPAIKPRQSVDRISDHFQQLVLSPENYKEELRQYSEPLEEACRHLVPRTYAYLKRYYRRERLISAFRRLFGQSEESSFAVKLVD